MLTMLKGSTSMRSPFNRNFIEKVPVQKMEHVLTAAELIVVALGQKMIANNRKYNIEFYAATVQDVQRVMNAFGITITHSELDRPNNGYKLFKEGELRNSFAFARINDAGNFTVVMPMAKSMKELDALTDRFNEKADTAILEQLDAFCLITPLKSFVNNPIDTQAAFIAFNNKPLTAPPMYDAMPEEDVPFAEAFNLSPEEMAQINDEVEEIMNM